MNSLIDTFRPIVEALVNWRGIWAFHRIDPTFKSNCYVFYITKVREMKVLITLLTMLLFAFSAYAQQKPIERKVDVITMGVVPVSQIKVKKAAQTQRFVRLYRRPNTRVKRALSFTTVKDRPKVA
ncbi:MAG: hypothetical protein P8X60_11245 [Robiginitalea sp.]|jgi:hypothetical protein